MFAERHAELADELITPGHRAQGGQAPCAAVISQRQAKPDQSGQMRRRVFAQGLAELAQLQRISQQLAALTIPFKLHLALHHRRPAVIRQQRHAVSRQREIERFFGDARPGLGPFQRLIRIEQTPAWIADGMHLQHAAVDGLQKFGQLHTAEPGR
ncbi:hypothetical protein D3C81_945030 [compost metagenome]